MASDALVGRVLAGRFRITKFLNEGGMGAIYEGACDGEDGIAIKVMSADVARNETYVRRFQREAKTIARIKHRSTVRIIDHGVDAGLPFIAMELVRGAELATILEHEKRISEARAARLMAQVCSALAAAHDLGVVHRDLKPENVMVYRDPADPNVELVKVLDFGIAKIMSPDLLPEDALPVSSDAAPPSSQMEQLTKVGSLIGTPEYMAPEQFRGEPVDARTDVYACGLLLHRMITGLVPLAADDWIKTSMLRGDAVAAPRMTETVPDTFPGLDDLVFAALTRDPSARPQSARKMHEALVALLPDLAGIVLPVKPGVSIAAKTRPTSGSAWSGQTLPSPGTPTEAPEAPTRVLGAPDAAPSSEPLPDEVAATLPSSGPVDSNADSRPESVPVKIIEDRTLDAGEVVIRKVEKGDVLGEARRGKAPAARKSRREDRAPAPGASAFDLRSLLVFAVAALIAAAVVVLVSR